ncbi:MAG: serine/threonine protein kinase [Planctomycetes bacterium]|nr:serine/threonine protein kinase [Planctomycetota bacterium]
MMGTKVSEQQDPAGNSLGIAIGHLALKRGFITPEQLRDALIEQSRSGDRPLDAILLARGFLTRDQLELLHAARETAVRPAAAAPDSAPSQVGKYRVVREAGRGAMARVFEAFDSELQRKVALKLLITSPNAHPEESKLEEERFLREARLCANLPKHPNIVGVYDAGVADGRRYLAMEFVAGVPMDKWCKKGSVTIGRPTTLLRDIALAVHHAHEHGVIHRDLKPANILVDDDNQPHVMDFGLAKLVGRSIQASYTEGGLAVGTPAYMSPEQASGVKTVDRRTDIYSMGVMLYEILTGKLPFSGSTPMEIMVKTSKDPVVPPSKITSVQINPIHFKTLEGVCMKALAKDPGNRYATAEQFAADLTRWLRGKDFRVSDARLNRWVIGSLAAAILLALAGGALQRWKPWRANVEADLALGDRLLAEGKAEEALVAYSRAAGREADNVRAGQGRDLALKKLREKLAPQPEDPWKAAISLLPVVDVPKDVVSGNWSRTPELLVSEGGKPARLQIAYRPPEEYDLRFVFARHSTNWCVNLILTRSGDPFTLVMQRDGYFGFEKVRGEDFNKNVSVKRFDTPIQLNHEYTVLVEVRKSGVKSFCDGQPMSRLDTYDGVSMNRDWKLPDPAALGLGTWDGGATIRRLEVREVTGKGQWLRTAKKD